MASTPTFLTERLQATVVGDVRVLDAVIEDQQTTVTLGGNAAETQVGISAQSEVAVASGGRAVTRQHLMQVTGDRLSVTVGSEVGQVVPTTAQPHLFSGLNVLLGVRQSESADTVAEWMQFHHAHHGAEAAIVVDCGPPNDRSTFQNDLKARMIELGGMLLVVVVTSPIPLGARGVPAADHPINAPASPGRAKMDKPKPDEWRAPMSEPLVLDALRLRFLGNARAVLFLNTNEILPRIAGAASVFDQARALDDGYLMLAGRDCYPWRIRQDAKPVFADHVCVQFDKPVPRQRWAVAPQNAPNAVWRFRKLSGVSGHRSEFGFHRCISLRHPDCAVSEIVPKTSLVEDPDLVRLALNELGGDPVRVPKAEPKSFGPGPGHTTIVTCMKDEGPFILEWLAHHRAIGINRFLVYTNDCSDGTDTMLDLLQVRGLVEHRKNPYRETGQKPQHAAFLAAEAEPLVKSADWLVCLDVDEYINIHVGDGTIGDLYDAAGDANMIAMTWRLFGNADVAEFRDQPVTEQFTRCARPLARKPHQAWGFKTLFRHQGLFRKLGVHRPKGLIPQLKDHIHWVNGSGQRLPETFYRNSWRSTSSTYGYDLVTLNHYAVRSAESFLVKRNRGRVNHVERDQGLIYWFRMNNNAEEDRSISRLRPSVQAELARMMRDPDIEVAHQTSVARHKARIFELRSREDYAAFYDELISERMQRLSRMHAHFGSGVFWSGPQVVPDDVINRDPSETFFFTVEPQGEGHEPAQPDALRGT